MPLLKQCSFRQLKSKHNKINSYDINLLGALTFSEHWIHSHHEWRLILWFLGSPEPPVCSCSLSLQLTGRLPWVKTSVYLHRKWKPWEQKKHPVRTKSEEGKKVLIVCSSGHITTGPVPGVLQCPRLKAVAHTHSFQQGEKPSLHLGPQAITTHFLVSRKKNICHSSLAVTFSLAWPDPIPLERSCSSLALSAGTALCTGRDVCQQVEF